MTLFAKFREIVYYGGFLFNMDDIDLDLEGNFVLVLISAPLDNLVCAIYFEQINAELPNSQK